VRFYVDFGANVGDTIAAWLAKYPDSTVLGVEPNAELCERLAGRFGDDSRVTIVAAAAGTHDGEAILYPGIRSHESSTLITGKDPKHSWRVDYGNGIPVPVVDAARLILDHWPQCDDAVIKIDIEAGEYELVPYLIGAGVLARFSEARVEWHWRKFNVSRKKHDAVRNALAKVTRVVDWK